MARDEWPEGWEVRRLGEVVLPTETRDPRKDPEAVFKYVDISSVDNAAFQIIGYKEYRGEEAPSRARKVVRTNDVIFATTRPYLRSVAIVPPELDNQICSTGFCVLRSNGMADPKWIFALARSDVVIDPVVKAMRGANYPAVTDRDVLAVEIPLPPLDKQRRIVARIEELTRRIEEARGLRQAACQEAAAIMPAALAEVFGRAEAEGWETQHLDQVANVNMGQSPPGSSYNDRGDGLPLINGPTEFGPHHPIPAQWTNQPTKTCCPGDILICVRGATTGRMNWADQVYCIGRGLAALTVDESMCLSGYVYAFVQTQTQEILARSAGSTFPNLRSEELKALRIPVPPLSEQRCIVTYLDGLQARVEALRRLQEETEAEVAAMSGAVLAKVFRGEL